MAIQFGSLSVRFRPKLLDVFKKGAYNKDLFRADALAGLTVGVVALPLAMAFAIASGVKPEQGLVTAIVAGFLISALGGTKLCIGGPTGAFIVVLYGVLVKYGWANLVICTIMAGIFLILMGVFRLGALIRFVPNSVIVGFTNGIAVLIALTQIRDYFGLKIDKMPGEFFGIVKALWTAAPTVSLPTLLVGVIALTVMFQWPKTWNRKVPAPVAVLIVGTLAVWLTQRYFPQTGIATVGSRFGEIPRAFPTPAFPSIQWETLGSLLPPAITIALLAAIESLLCAVVADQQTGAIGEDKHDANQELIAQGIANVMSPLFGGLAATGAIARTTTNVRNGAVSPVSGIVHAIVLLLIMLIAAPLATHIPLVILAAILLTVAYNMGEWHAFRDLHRYTPFRNVTLLATFFLTVLFDLTIAVEVGMVLATILLIKRLSAAASITRIEALHQDPDAPHLAIPAHAEAYRLRGALYFGVADQIESLLKRPRDGTHVVALEMREVIYLDSTAQSALRGFIERTLARGVRIVIISPSMQAKDLMRRTGTLDLLDVADVVDTRRQGFARLQGIAA